MGLSTYQILKQKRFVKKLKTIAEGVRPISIEWGQDRKQPLIKFSDGGWGTRFLHPLYQSTLFRIR